MLMEMDLSFSLDSFLIVRDTLGTGYGHVFLFFLSYACMDKGVPKGVSRNFWEIDFFPCLLCIS